MRNMLVALSSRLSSGGFSVVARRGGVPLRPAQLIAAIALMGRCSRQIAETVDCGTGDAPARRWQAAQAQAALHGSYQRMDGKQGKEKN